MYSFKNKSYLNISEEEIFDLFDRQPSFNMFHDNYFISGVPTNKKIDETTADAKYQISISQRLVKSRLPFNTSLFLTYTQKSFWNLYQYSSPFGDNNYNPGFSLIKPIVHNNQFRGGTVISIEHESNGLDSIDSRSWNYITISGAYFYNSNFSVQAKVWAGILGENTEDLFKYKGHGLLALNYRNNNDKLWLSLILNPRSKLSGLNTTLEVNFKPNENANQYLFLQWYNGYGESLIDYNQYTSMVRIGICIKPTMRNLY